MKSSTPFYRSNTKRKNFKSISSLRLFLLCVSSIICFSEYRHVTRKRRYKSPKRRPEHTFSGSFLSKFAKWLDRKYFGVVTLCD